MDKVWLHSFLGDFQNIPEYSGKRLEWYCRCPKYTQTPSWLTPAIYDKRVNDNPCLFLAETFKQTFATLTDIQPEVLYPSLNFSAFNADIEPPGDLIPSGVKTLFLSINRYERKKNLGLAIEAMGRYLPFFSFLFLFFIFAKGYNNTRWRANKLYNMHVTC